MKLLELAEKLKRIEELNYALKSDQALLEKMTKPVGEGQFRSTELTIELQQEKCASIRKKLAELEQIDLLTGIPF